jgi:hypothetical protein
MNASTRRFDTQRFGIALMLVLGFFAVLAYMLYADWPKEQVSLMVGALIGSFVRAPQWYLDSSPGSERKTELLAQADSIPAFKPPET